MFSIDSCICSLLVKVDENILTELIDYNTGM
jgi:hypothetical protein